MGQPRARRRQFLGMLAGATAGAGLAAGPARDARAQGAGRGPSNGDADLVLTSANVITMDAAAPRAEAVAIKDERILAVGTDDEMRALAGRGTEVRNLRGLTVLPGFYDSHYHLLRAGISLADVDLSPTRT